MTVETMLAVTQALEDLADEWDNDITIGDRGLPQTAIDEMDERTDRLRAVSKIVWVLMGGQE